MKALIRQSIRRWRNWLERKHWQMTKRLRQPEREFIALDPLIAQARKAHRPTREIVKQRQAIVHERLRRSLPQ